MSNTKKSKSPQKPHRVPVYQRPHFLIILGIMLVVLVIIAVVLRIQQNNSTSQDDSATSNQSSQNLPDVDSDQTTPGPSADDPGQTPTQFEGKDPNDLSGLTGSITLKSYNGTTLTVAAVIDQYLSANGSCTLNLKQNGRTILSETLEATPDVTASGCGPFRLSASSLTGTYQLEIILNGDDKSGIITDEITI